MLEFDRMRALRFLTSLGLLLATGCAGNGGAVSVRWQIVDLSTGARFDPRDVADIDGNCTAMYSETCGVSSSWIVHRVKVVVASPTDSGSEVLADDTRLEFACNAREATTPFIIPSGTFAVSLRAFDPSAADDVASEGLTPAPAVRIIHAAEIVNLDVVEIGVHPLPTAAQAADGGCP